MLLEHSYFWHLISPQQEPSGNAIRYCAVQVNPVRSGSSEEEEEGDLE